MEMLKEYTTQVKDLPINKPQLFDIDKYQLNIVSSCSDKIYTKWISELRKIYSFSIKQPPSKHIISAYLFHYFHADLLGDTELDNSIRVKASELIDIIDNTMTSIINNTITSNMAKITYDTMNSFSDSFMVWKKGDIEYQMNNLIQLHCQLEVHKLSEEMNKEKKDTEINHIKSLMKSITDYIHILKGNNGLNELKNAKYDIVAYDPSTISLIESKLHQCFWDMFTVDLQQSPPNWRLFPGMINDCNIILKKIVNSVDSIIDQELNETAIRTSIEDKLFSIQMIYDILIFTLTQIKQLGPPIRDNQVDKLLIELHETMKCPSKIILHEYIPKYMQECLNRLSVIHQEKELYLKRIKSND